MKQKDIALIIVVSFISAIFSYILSNAIVGSPSSKREKVEVVEAITSDFTQPDKRYFNPDSVNPTQIIQIGNNPNNSSFRSGSGN
jgi:hypothetical protein